MGAGYRVLLSLSCSAHSKIFAKFMSVEFIYGVYRIKIMSRLFSIRPAYFFFVTSLCVLGGCQTQQAIRGAFEPSSVTAEKSSEELLDGEGQMVLVEDKRAPTPIEMHMKARGDVDPTRINKKNKFTTNIKDSHAKDQTNFRVVRVEGDAEAMADADGDLTISANPLEKKTSAKTYVEEILEKHKARQAAATKVDVGQVKNTRQASLDVASSDVEVGQVRIGQHPGKTRVVLDVSDKASFQTRFESGDKVLVVTLPNASWATEPRTKVAGESLVVGYDASNKGAGSVLKITLTAPGKLAYQKAMKPSGGRGQRIVLDIVTR